MNRFFTQLRALWRPEDWAQRLTQLRSRHAQGVAASVIAVLGGLTAVSYAVAPLAPDAALLPTQILTEEVRPVAIAPQLEALASHELQLHTTEVTRPGTSLEGLLRRLGVSDPKAIKQLKAQTALTRAVEGKAGRLVTASVDRHGVPTELIVRMPEDRESLSSTQFKRLSLKWRDGAWVSQLESVALSSEVRMASGRIQSSLFAATDDARIPDAIATQMAELFATDIDFHRELRKGDTFSVVFESPLADGEPVPWSQGAGKLLAAEFVNDGRTYQAIWFENKGKGAYFDPSGRSRTRQFLASPMAFSRVTSGFAMRMHPILQQMRAHKGIDYGAPTGTPVRVVGDGMVEFAGFQGGYGNVIRIKHSASQATVYAHLSRIDVRQGQRVEQGQRIGAVGATGWATGPHLHFEFLENGVHVNPTKIAKAAQTLTLDAKSKPDFQALAQVYQQKLDLAETLGVSGKRFE